VIMPANEPTGLWAVLQGSVSLSRISAGGSEFIFYVAGPGFWLGAFGIVSGRPLDVVVTSLGESTLLSIPRAAAERIVESDQRFQTALARLSMDRFARTLDALESTRRLNPVSRVAAKLLGIRALDVETDSATAEQPLAISQNALALMTSLSRQSVSAALHELARVGAIAVGFKEITVLDQDRLQAVADEGA